MKNEELIMLTFYNKRRLIKISRIWQRNCVNAFIDPAPGNSYKMKK